MNFDSYYSPPDVDVPEWVQLRSTCHTARIPHTCEACGQPINPGDRYTALVGVYGADEPKLVTSKTHFGGCPGWDEHWDEEGSMFPWEDRI